MAEIPLSQLEQIFHGMRSEAGWNTDADLLWGYFFTHGHPAPLGALAAHLAERSYSIVNVYPTDDHTSYVLHAERVETHTTATLATRNAELNLLANQFGVFYDGMDAGPVQPPALGPSKRWWQFWR
jgi:hypothetical protein